MNRALPFALLSVGAALALAGTARAQGEPASGSSVVAPLTTYRVTGSKLLRPSRMSDDGVHTYIEWPEDHPLPAVFAINEAGTEEMVNGYMREGLFTVDMVAQRLVFRLDKAKAEAIRNASPEPRQ
jgi:type IV secretion system protein VirB9